MILYPKEQLLTPITIPYKRFLFLQEVHFGARKDVRFDFFSNRRRKFPWKLNRH